MTQSDSADGSRQQRRKERTRAALVRAAQALLAAGKTDVPIVEITQAADVGMGSFYNHFDSKDQLFQAAVEQALDGHGGLLDQLTAGLDDPAEIFAQSFRLTGRLPELSKVLLHNALALARSDNGLAPRAHRDLDAATRAGRFTVRDPELALAVIAGATLCLGQLLHTSPTATTRTPPTRSPRTCCACSAFPPPKRTGSVCVPYPVPAIRRASHPRSWGHDPPFPRRSARRTGQHEFPGTRRTAGALAPGDQNADQR